MSKYGPSRGELKFRVAFAVFGLGLMLVAISIKEVRGPAWMEVVGLSVLFFGGTGAHAAWKLWKTPRE